MSTTPRTKRADIATAPIPPGYFCDGSGRWVPERYRTEQDQTRDAVVTRLVAACRAQSERLSTLKARLFADLAGHVRLVADAHGVRLTGRGGSVVLVSTDGRMRIERIVSPRMRVGAAILAAEALVSELLADLTEDARPELKALVNQLFKRDAAGTIAPSRLLDFIRLDIPDARWHRAQAAVRAALESDGTAVYFRAYTRTDPTQPWEQINLDFSRTPFEIAPEAA